MLVSTTRSESFDTHDAIAWSEVHQSATEVWTEIKWEDRPTPTPEQVEEILFAAKLGMLSNYNYVYAASLTPRQILEVVDQWLAANE